MKNFRFYLILILTFLLSLSYSNAIIYNQAGDFSIDVGSFENKIFNNNIKTNFNFTIINNKDIDQNFKIIISNQSGWDIFFNSKNFIIPANSKKNINLNLVANNNFDYSTDFVSSNVIRIAKKEDYSGNFIFPMKIEGNTESMNLKFSVSIKKKPLIPISFKTTISTEKLSPKTQLKYSIQGVEIKNDSKVFVRVELANNILSEFSDTFTKNNNLKFYQEKISSDFKPGFYNAKITIRIPQLNGKSVIEWSETKKLEISEFKNIIVKNTYKKSLFKEDYTIVIFNDGNLDQNYTKEFNISYFKSFLLGSNFNYITTSNGIKFEVPLKKGEQKNINYSINYFPIYVILLIAVILLIYIIVRKNSNPLDVENKIYEIKNIVNEGVKSLKIRIGFENIKEAEIDELKIVFRMPSYLSIKDNSFSLTEPNHVLKGKKQYKLIWNFKRFEKEDSRILGFALINGRGILGDIKLPDLEFEVKINGKLRKYYKAFPIIRG